MKYILKNVITSNGKFASNEDGSIAANGIIAVVVIEDAPENKFVQKDIMPEFIIPGSVSNKDNPAFIEQVAIDYVKNIYPNT